MEVLISPAVAPPYKIIFLFVFFLSVSNFTLQYTVVGVSCKVVI